MAKTTATANTSSKYCICDINHVYKLPFQFIKEEPGYGDPNKKCATFSISKLTFEEKTEIEKTIPADLFTFIKDKNVVTSVEAYDTDNNVIFNNDAYSSLYAVAFEYRANTGEWSFYFRLAM